MSTFPTSLCKLQFIPHRSRWKRPDATRPIKVNIVLPLVFLVLCGFLVVFPLFGDEPELVGVAMAIIFSGVPVYAVFVAWKTKPTWLRKILSKY